MLRALADEFSGSAHARDFGLERASDDEIWHYARANGFMIVTLDTVFTTSACFAAHLPASCG